MAGRAARPGDYVFAYMRLDSGSTATHDLSSTSTLATRRFGYSPSNTVGNVIIERANFHIEDKPVIPTNFGGLSALTNGIVMRVTSSPSTAFSVLFDFTDGEGIKNNAEFGLLAGVDKDLDAGAADDTVNVRWTLSRAGKPLLLQPGETLECLTQDDLDGLDVFHILVQGVKESAF